MSSPLVRRAIATCAVCSCLLAFGCSTLKSLRDTARLRQQLIDRYHEPDINVLMRGDRYLVIAFVNSPLNNKDQIDRARRAQDAATFALKNFAVVNQINTVAVSFVASEGRLFVRKTRSLGFFVFDKNGLALDTSGASEDPSRPVARFNPARNETDVSITRLQLDGDMNHGIALVPHFTFKGNVHDANRVAPDSVVFDFASYADRKTFPASARLDILGDGLAVFSGTATLLTPQDSGSEDSTAQFLTTQIPFAQFAKIGQAREVKLKLGSKDFVLSRKDIDDLRAMSDYIPHPRE